MSCKRFVHHHRFIIQWHLTERCNWYCKHCYQGRRDLRELTFEELKMVFGQCLELFRALHIPKDRIYINIGGGEPFLREDLFKFLRLLRKYSNTIKIQIMTNGSLITESIAKDLKKLELRGIQVSLEGLRESNDKIRGRGSFEKTISTIKILRKYNIVTRVSLTLTKFNLNELDDLAIYLKELGVSSFGPRRYVCMGRGERLREFMLTPLELKDYYFKREEIKKRLDEPEKFKITYGCEDAIFLDRGKFRHHNCGVVIGHHLHIFANGDILPCRRLPIVVGNVLKNSLLDIYFSSNKLWSFRTLDNAHLLCRKCSYFKYCLGGAKCVSYAYFGDSFAPDPQCWRISKELPKLDRYKTS